MTYKITNAVYDMSDLDIEAEYFQVLPEGIIFFSDGFTVAFLPDPKKWKITKKIKI